MRHFVDIELQKAVFDEFIAMPGVIGQEVVDAMKKQSENSGCEIRKTVCRMVRLASSDMAAMSNLIAAVRPRGINTLFTYTKPDRIPLMMFDRKDPTKLVVFPNIYVVMYDLALVVMPLVSMYYGYTKLLAEWEKSFVDDLSDANKKVKWSAKHWRATLLKRESVTIDRALAKYVWPGSEYSSDVIRDVASCIRSSREPVTLRLCETPSDYIAMYASSVTSCMSGTDKESRWGGMIKKDKIHPASFYYYHPSTQGAYITRGDAVIARTIIYTVNDKKYYGRIFPGDGNNIPFIEALKKIGVLGPLPDNQWSGEVEFTMPIYKGMGYDYIPVPYLDFWKSYLFVKIDKANNVAHLHTGSSPRGGYVVIVKDSQTGLRNVRDFMELTCDYCGTTYAANSCTGHKHSSNGGWVCTAQCRAKIGWVAAKRSDGAEVVITASDAVPDGLNGSYYTNQDAALRNGCREVISDFRFPDEHPIISRSTECTVVGKDGEHRHITRSILSPEDRLTFLIEGSGISDIIRRTYEAHTLGVSGVVVAEIVLDKEATHVRVLGSINKTLINSMLANVADDTSAPTVATLGYGDKKRTIDVISGTERDIFKLLSSAA